MSEVQVFLVLIALQVLESLQILWFLHCGARNHCQYCGFCTPLAQNHCTCCPFETGRHIIIANTVVLAWRGPESLQILLFLALGDTSAAHIQFFVMWGPSGRMSHLKNTSHPSPLSLVRVQCVLVSFSEFSDLQWVPVSAMISTEFRWVPVMPSEIKWNQAKASAMNWNQMKSKTSIEIKWNQVKTFTRWNEMTSSEIKWNHLKSDEVKWDIVKTREIKSSQVQSSEIKSTQVKSHEIATKTSEIKWNQGKSMEVKWSQTKMKWNPLK